jgi:hypothetical protein
MKTFILILASALLAACGGDTSSPANASPVGTFTLVSVDGHPLPASIGSTPSSGPWFVRGTLTIAASGSYTLTQADSGVGRAAASITETGTWAQAADTVKLTSKTAGRESYPAVLSGDVLVRNAYTYRFEFRRQ